MVCTVISAAIFGIEGQKILVEADASDGLPGFSMVGFLASEVKEAQDRVRTAIRNSGYVLKPKHITVNLSPADMRKEGSGFDLPIAIAVLTAMGFIPQQALEGILFAGELSLNGSINGIRGVMGLVDAARAAGCDRCIVPAKNLREGSVIQGIRVLGADDLRQVVGYLTGDMELKTDTFNIEEIRERYRKMHRVDFAEIRGQETVRRAAEVAVAGLHNLLIIGPPGAGKSMAARRIPTILPELSMEESLEISKIHSVAGVLSAENGLLLERPFRSPHHTITPTALAGGGRTPRPGEVSLAHRGVLYLDELPEFQNQTLEILRQPMEDGMVNISRNMGNYLFPADFMLVASMNPCKCGYYPDRNRCTCSTRDVKRYLDHISQPLLDRIDICVEAGQVSYDDLTGMDNGEPSEDIRLRVTRAQEMQQKRYQNSTFRFNSDLNGAGIEKYCHLEKEEEKLMHETYEKLDLTARSYSRILKVARTIADLDGSEQICGRHLAEAIQYRALDRKYWKEGMI